MTEYSVDLEALARAIVGSQADDSQMAERDIAISALAKGTVLLRICGAKGTTRTTFTPAQARQLAGGLQRAAAMADAFLAILPDSEKSN